MENDDRASKINDNVFSVRTWVAIGALLAACFILTALLQLREITDLDVWLFHEAREQYETALKSFLRIFTELGSLIVWFLVVPLLWAIHRKKEAGALFVALLMVILIAGTMKYAIDRPRPFDVIYAVDPVYRPTDPSFPSGHAMTIFASAVAIGSKWRRALVPLLVLAAAVGFSRVYIGVHFPYDVASGALIGILIGLVADSLYLSRMTGWTDEQLGRIGKRLGFSRGKEGKDQACAKIK
jgi:undecaprenyl-diphosphatase